MAMNPGGWRMKMDPALKRKKLYSEGVVRLREGRIPCEMKLYPLVTHSVLIRRHVESICENDGNLVIELLDCPGGPEIFGIVQDFSYGLMDENAISMSNVVGLHATSNFLEMDGLACRALQFLEEHVLGSWAKCLRVLATFDCNDCYRCNDLRYTSDHCNPCNFLEDADANSLFHKCKNAFLLHIRIPLKDSKTGTSQLCCNVRCLGYVAKLLSPRVAEHIYKCCRSEQLGLCFNYEAPDQSASDFVESSVQIPLCVHFRGGPMFTVEFNSPAADENHGVEWLAGLYKLLPTLLGHVTLVVHLAKSMFLGDNIKAPTGTICLSRFRWSFLCALLSATTWLQRYSGEYIRASPSLYTRASPVAQDLDKVIGDLQRMVSRGLRDVVNWNAATDCNLGDRNTDWSDGLNSHFIFKCVQAFSWDTLQAVFRHFGCLSFDQLAVSSLAEILDRLLNEKVQTTGFTVQQALLIYQEFPKDERRSHAGIYYVFQESLKRKALCAQDVRDLTSLLDYQKLPDEIVEELFEEFQIDCGPRLLQRFLAIQENRIRKEKSQENVIQMREKYKLRIDNFIKVCNEMSVRSADLIKMTEDKLFAESRLDEVVRDLEAEKEKSTLAVRKLQEVVRSQEAEKEKAALAECKLEKVVSGLNAEKKKTTLGKHKLKEVVRCLEAEQEKTTLAEDKLEEVGRGLEAEQEKTTCQICLERPRDALSLPCMHFMYCFDCLQLAHKKRKICPTCRSSTSGVLKCLLSA